MELKLPRKEEKTCSYVLQHNSPPKHNGDPSWEHIFGLQNREYNNKKFFKNWFFMT